MEFQNENMTIEETNPQTQYKTPSYTLRAVRKYQEKNKEKINSKWRERYENDPEFREKQKQLSREKYQKKKEKLFKK
jgi:hypothetical protein